MLSTTARYALRAVVCLAERMESGATRVPMHEIAAAADIPSNYLSKVMHRLARVGILTSTRGPSGGFEFKIPPDELVLASVTAEFEATGGPLSCLLKDQPCDPDAPCVAHSRWVDIAAEFRDFFEDTTVSALLHGDTDIEDAAEPPSPG